MNFKKNWKRFFTVSRASEGFTLVELIVVIAILAILAGIAVPAYSGYIKKANKAADLQLLGAVNTAFAAACLENGKDVNEINSATLRYGGNEGAVTVTGIASVAGENVDSYNTAFSRYYGNTGAFKVITRLIFDAEKHAFVDIATSGGATVSYRGTVVYIPAQLAATIRDSSFSRGENGIADIADRLGDVTDIAAGLVTDEDYATFIQNSLYETFGVTDTTDLAQMQAFGTKMNELTAQKVELLKNDENALAAFEAARSAALEEGLPFGEEEQAEWWNNQASGQIAASNAILFAAQNSSSLNTETFLATLSDPESTMTASQFKSFLTDTEDRGQALANTAATYAMYTAYTNTLQGEERENAQANLDSLTQMTSAANGINSQGFKDYLASEQAEADLNAYMASIELINNTAGSGNASVDSLLVNGFADQALKDLLSDAIG